jgi:hypothetical protein
VSIGSLANSHSRPIVLKNALFAEREASRRQGEAVRCSPAVMKFDLRFVVLDLSMISLMLR